MPERPGVTKIGDQTIIKLYELIKGDTGYGKQIHNNPFLLQRNEESRQYCYTPDSITVTKELLTSEIQVVITGKVVYEQIAREMVVIDPKQVTRFLHIDITQGDNEITNANYKREAVEFNKATDTPTSKTEESLEGEDCLKFIDDLLRHWTMVINEYYINQETHTETRLPSSAKT